MLHIMKALFCFVDILGTFINNLWTEICRWTSVLYVITCSYISCPNEQVALYFPKEDQCLELLYQQPCIVHTYKLFITLIRLLYSYIVILHPVFKWTRRIDVHERETCIYEWMIVETIKITEVLTREERDFFFLSGAF